MSQLTRREFVTRTALAAAAVQLANSLRAADQPAPASSTGSTAPAQPEHLHWLEGGQPSVLPGTTWGRAWPRGQHAAATPFKLTSAEGAAVPVQTWPLAFWPDGSLKWTAHAIPADAPLSAGYALEPGQPAAPARAVVVRETADEVVLDNGVVQVAIARRGGALIRQVVRDGREIARDGGLVCQLENRAEPGVTRTENFQGEIGEVVVEQSGPVRAVVRISGRHAGAGRTWLPFVVRCYLHAGGEMLRVMHTIIFDGEAAKDFISGLGLRFTVPLRGEWHDRHVRFGGPDDGIFGEAVRGITGLRRDPGAAVRAAQVAGAATPPLAEWNAQVASRLQYIPAYSDWTLLQASCDGFEISKRTKAGHTWLSAARGQRAGGLGYVGTPTGGVAFGLRNFWQSYPAQLDVRGATSDAAEVTVWMWAPGAEAMDLRPYHDGLGQDTFAKQYNGGLEITYEDYEPGFNSPEGVARTSEIHLWFAAATPTRDRLAAMQQVLHAPPLLVSTPHYLHRCGVFGSLWSPVDRSTPARAAIEDRLAWSFDFYRDQQEQRRWYGFWNYGDVMHTYDPDRHEWRYDVGGFAWDNSELSTDIWLWLSFLRTGRADVFRFAEAMTRHTGEVDVHHLGRFAPLGSRHNVQHWGCSAKQLRIATALNRRYYYFLTGDERVGDLMREQIEAAHALVRIPPGRKLSSAENPGDMDRGKPSNPDVIGLSVGTDWGSLAGAWLTEWERTGSEKMRARLLASMKSLGAQPRGFFSVGLTMHLDTGEFARVTNDKVGVSHLNAVFGLVEVCDELNQLLDVPEFKRAWLDYCELYNAPAAEQQARLGSALRGNGLTQGHARLTAYAAFQQQNAELGARVWKEFSGGEGGRRGPRRAPTATRVAGSAVLRPVDEAVMVSTNDTAQSGLAAIQCLAWAGRYLPSA